ncbi:MAG: cyclic nucleotide-binding/CBS domain-containing protein [Caldilineaceae bacterium]|nr:cyclic nucleotide-binding/CBS domain-containing protein [Caldilineaceae bacterium]
MNSVEFLRHYPPFDSLTPKEFALLAADVEVMRAARGSAILQRGKEPSRYVYVVQQGTVSMLTEGQIYQVLETGESFGYPSLLSGEAPAYDVVAAEDTVLYRLPEPLFRTLLDNVAFAEYYLKSLIDRLRRATDTPTTTPERNLATPVKFLVAQPPLFVHAAATVQEAAHRMHAAGVSSILVQTEPPGILTDRDLRGKVLAAGLGPETPVQQVMSRPLQSMDSDAPVYRALQIMLEENIHHLALVEEGEIVGLISNTDLLRHQAQSPLFLQRQIAAIEEGMGLESYAKNITAMVESLFRGGLESAQIGQMVATLNDALIRRLAQLAEAHLGPPPVPYGWIVFGSEGRSEQLLLTDQDNALIYAEATPEAEHYFAALAESVVAGLIQAGFPPCPGGYMATQWCKPLAEWESVFVQWINRPEPQALMEASIFFDFRKVHGALSLEPLEEIIAHAHTQQLFIGHMVRAAQEFAPPLGFFGRIRSDDGFIDLKQGGIAPIVGLARACALAAGSRERSTLERLVIAAESGTISKEGAETLAETFRFLMRLRLQAQLAGLHAEGSTMSIPSNRVNYQMLSPLERRNLKEAFSSIRQMQEGIGASFRTGMMG